MREVETYIEAFENAPDLKDGWRTLSSHMGQYVLAAKMESPKENAMRFATWMCNDRGVDLGHYFSSFDAAEKDFMDRCGYEKPFFTEQELRGLHAELIDPYEGWKVFDTGPVIFKLEERFPDLEMQAEGEAEFD